MSAKTALPPAQVTMEVKTCPYDARFPNQNQTRNCWQNYVDFQRCKKIKGEDYAPCEYFHKVYKSLCPNEWMQDDNLCQMVRLVNKRFITFKKNDGKHIL